MYQGNDLRESWCRVGNDDAHFICVLDMNPRIKYCVELDRIKEFPDYQRLRAEVRFLLIKEYEDDFLKQETLRLGTDYKKHRATKKFCKINEISRSSLFRWLRTYRKLGIVGLIPLYGIQALGADHNAMGLVAICKPEKRHRPIIPVRLDIDPGRPLYCLNQLAKFISSSPNVEPMIKESCIRALSFISDLARRRTTLSLATPFKEQEKQRLQRYQAGSHKHQSARATAILMAEEHRTLLDIGMETGAPRTTIYRWLRKFNSSGLKSIETRYTFPLQEKATSQRKTRVIDIIHKQPSFYDINRTSWTYGAIMQAYKKAYGETVSEGVVQRIIKKTGFTWRRARKVWTSPDPLYREKIGKVIDTLQNLKVGEAFFFVDEAGPYRVKKYGGKALTPDDEHREIPENQSPKGSVQFIAALEALSNQVTWRFIPGRNTRNIISMLGQLCSDYALCSTLFVTWDDISCHRSHVLKEWINLHNLAVSTTSAGPMVTIVPLPSRAQFLNVIESVFGGMKKAIIYNSDYGSKKEMEEAIARHFEERNRFFQENPKRAGNKIWDKEAFDLEKLPGGLFKTM